LHVDRSQSLDARGLPAGDPEVRFVAGNDCADPINYLCSVTQHIACGGGMPSMLSRELQDAVDMRPHLLQGFQRSVITLNGLPLIRPRRRHLLEAVQRIQRGF
jgi:hypothetical protein